MENDLVIKGLKYLHDRETWKEGPLVWDDKAEERRKITGDAIALLKEWKPIKPVIHIVQMMGSDALQCYECGVCGKSISPGDKYCRECGRKVKWDG